MDLAVVLPTYNERDNIPELIARLEDALQGLRWELMFVDDDSPDGTSDVVRSYARRDPRIRLLHRVGRRGLSSACIEGIMATSANHVAVMDADLQHDETILPKMLARLHEESLDIVVATRNAEGGSMGEFSRKRVFISKMGKKVSDRVCRCELTDPMSGFFLLKRSFFLEVVHHLHHGGFKILVDILSSTERPVCLGEVGYCFRNRIHGKSKLDVNTAVEYLFLVTNKMMGGIIPIRFALFSLVGAAGVATHLLCLGLLYHVLHLPFLTAQAIATVIAMTENFFLNNLITFRDRSLRGLRLISGLASFWLACSFGAWANVIFARALLQSGAVWYLAGLAGIIIGSVWNYSISNLFTWQMPHRHRSPSIPDSIADPVEAHSTE
ncbi:MAG TPA: glycosyltransferase family 2 protein [Acidobacteriaceae bacterium]